MKKNKEKFIKIKNLKIGNHFNPVVIAEIGINHNGSLSVAKKMAKLAIKSGAHIIKHQTHIVDDEMSSEAKTKKIKYIGSSIYDLMKKCSLDETDELKLKKYIESLGGIFISTPFSRAAVDRLVKFNVPAFKIGSGECNNYPLVEYICSFRKPIIMSTGMNNLKDIDVAVKIVRKKNIPFALMHTTNIYPTPFELVRLDSINQLQKRYPDAIIGLSDHTTSNLACLGAIALGASIVERHFTDNMKRKGPDISCSMDPKTLKELTIQSKIMKKLSGGEKKLIKEEMTVKKFAFASVVSIKEIKKGEKLSNENIWVKRPGNGDFHAKEFGHLIGKRALKNIATNKQINKTDIIK
jgi:N-acetylneuraminate synthase|tara:strand:- start:2271 stop:3326 length:1056 start_codon:yes stop_codon:yes gene_type:complete